MTSVLDVVETEELLFRALKPLAESLLIAARDESSYIDLDHVAERALRRLAAVFHVAPHADALRARLRPYLEQLHESRP